MRPGDEREDDEGGEAPCFAHLLDDDAEAQVEGELEGAPDEGGEADPPVLA